MDDKKIKIEIERVIEYLSQLDPDSPEYSMVADNLKTLYEARSKKKALVVEPEVIVAALVNLLGIVVIIRHEEFNVLTSKALNFIRPK